MSKKISILGTGWLGLPLAKHLLSKGYTVKGSTTSEEKISQFSNLGIQPYLIDLNDKTLEEQSKDFFETDILIITIPPKRNIERYTTQMKAITKVVQNSPIQHIIYTSSTGVYDNAKGLVNETTALQPTTISGKAVALAEKILFELNKNLTICRLAGLIGEQRNPARFLAGRQNIPNGNAPVNLVHQKDCVQVITQIIEKNIWNEIFNVCADTHPPRNVFYPLQAKKLELEAPTFIADNTPLSEYKTIDNQKVKHVLGYEFVYSDISNI